MTESFKTAEHRGAQDSIMTADLSAASAFMATHARLLDRRRFQLLVGEADAGSVVAALDAYRNRDGGYGWGLEPDLRSPESQPGAALHAFEVFEDISPATASQSVGLCDWLESIALPDGGLPFALPVTSAAGCAPFWVQADATVSSLQITAVVAAAAHRVAASDPEVAAHPWLERATRYCFAAIEAMTDTPFALELAFAVQLVDAASTSHPEAVGLLDQLATRVPSSGMVHVAGGLDDEMMRALDFAPTPGGPARSLVAPDVIDAELQRLIDQQEDDGGWMVDFASYSPAAALEWRGHMTVRALSILRRNARL
jgi:hypothetical protein